MEEFLLRLTTDEINLIFKALGERPFHEVFELIGKINDQVNQQLNTSWRNDLPESGNNSNSTDE